MVIIPSSGTRLHLAVMRCRAVDTLRRKNPQPRAIGDRDLYA